MKTIAISTGIKDDKLTIDKSFTDLVAMAGFLPIVLAPNNSLPEPKKNFDALILADGLDVTPLYYNEEPLPELGKTNQALDQYEINLIKASREAHLPILGIGRGMHLMNVAFGGSLFQDIYEQNSGAGIQHMQAIELSHPSHHINMVPGNHLTSIIGDHPYVNSLHHQAIKNLADNFNVVATAPDNIIEAIESNDQSMLGIQWRPDKLLNDTKQITLIKNFFNSISD